ncbi:hypothetical protein KAW18_07285 [candidate division WOR-3 bacterium]|nr:hypothetical protein [candidate division WOR-3 bacterium]
MMLYAILLMQIFIGQSGSSGKPAVKLPLAEKLFPEAELIWSEPFEGKMIDFAIAEKSGYIVIGAVKKDWKGQVYLFTRDGKLLWTKENVKDSEIKECAGIKVSVSDSCETIGIFWWGDFEREEVQVYDITGEKLYSCEHGMAGVGVEISPGGGYVKHAWFFDKTGKRIVLRDILKGLPNIRDFEFVSEKEIVVLANNILYLFSFPEGELKWRSEELEGGGKITVQGSHIILSGGLQVYRFEKDERLLWKTELDKSLSFPQIISLSRDEKYVGFYGAGKIGILVLDFETGEIKVCTPRLISQIGAVNLLCLGNKVFLSGYANRSVDKHKGYWTYILHFDENGNMIDEMWKRELVLGGFASPVIGVYGSDATGKTKTGYEEGVLGFENSTQFTINILKVRD